MIRQNAVNERIRQSVLLVIEADPAGFGVQSRQPFVRSHPDDGMHRIFVKIKNRVAVQSFHNSLWFRFFTDGWPLIAVESGRVGSHPVATGAVAGQAENILMNHRRQQGKLLLANIKQEKAIFGGGQHGIVIDGQQSADKIFDHLAVG